MPLFQAKDEIPSTFDAELKEKLQHKIDHLTKPLGALGRLEEIAIKIGLLQQILFPSVLRKVHLIFASDHRITEEGVSAYPSEVTIQMVMNMLQGGAAINVFCRSQDIPCKVYDVGVLGEMPGHPDLHQVKIRPGTRNFFREKALTPEELDKAMGIGSKAVALDYPYNDLYCFGEMGIGNTSPATAVLSVLTGLSVEEVCGVGTGIKEEQRKQKVKVITQALEFHKPDPQDAIDVLSSVGGLEIAALTGAILEAARNKKVVIIDGVITGAAYLLACRLQPNVKDYCFLGHKSADQASRAIFNQGKEKPLLDLEMRLGEGTGAILSVPLLEAACDMINKMASFESAKVSQKTES